MIKLWSMVNRNICNVVCVRWFCYGKICMDSSAFGGSGSGEL